MDLKLDPNSLTVGDLIDFEAATGEKWSDVFKSNQQPSGNALAALVWILGRRDDPSFTLEAARDVKVTELAFSEAVAESPPTGAAS